jgi:hypothetical protein
MQMIKSGITFLVILSILILIVAVSDCTSSNNSVINKTYRNSFISFQYPGNLNVTELTGMNTVIIQTGHSTGTTSKEAGVTIQVMDLTTYNTVVKVSASTWKFRGKITSPGGTPYLVFTKNFHVSLTDYLFTKNGKYYDMYANSVDVNLMERLVDSRK